MYGEISLLSCSSYLKSRMIKKGILSLMDLMTGSAEDLHKSLKASKNQIIELQQESEKLISSQPFSLVTSPCIPTLFPELNEKLKGGIRACAIYELVGHPGSGRTYFAMTLSGQWLRTLQGSKVFYLDCEGSVDLASFSSVFEAGEKNRVLISRVTCERQLLAFFKDFCKIVPAHSLVVVDSFNFLMKEVWNEQKSKAKLMLKLGIDLLKSVHQTETALILVNGLNNNSQVLFGESWGSIVDKRLKFSKIDSMFLIDLV